MESCPTQAVLPLVRLAADKVIRDRYNLRGVGWGKPLGPWSPFCCVLRPCPRRMKELRD
ncbi:MAG: hypothetical protein ACQESR_01400 [Planctomycetota bacterium]